MATEKLDEEYLKLLEENYHYEQLLCQQKDQLVSLEKEITAAKKWIQQQITVPDGFFQQQEKDLRRKESRWLKNLEKETKRFDDIMHRNMDAQNNVSLLVKLKNAGRKLQQKLDKQLAELRDTMDDLQSATTAAFNQRSKAETQMMKLKESLDEERSQFSKKNMKLSIDIEHEAKLQTFIKKKLQDNVHQVADKTTKTAKRGEQLESDEQNYSSVLASAGKSDPSRIFLTLTQTKQENFNLMNKITDLKNKGNMLENRIHRMKSDILMLEQEAKGLNEQSTVQLKDLETELETHTGLADSLDEQNQAAKSTLDELTAAVSSCLKEFRKPPEVTSHNIIDSIVILTENVQNLLMEANSQADEQNRLLPNFALLPDQKDQTFADGEGENELSKITASSRLTGQSFRTEKDVSSLSLR